VACLCWACTYSNRCSLVGTACIKHADNASCTADASANYCQWCGLVSAGVPQIGCTDMWTCAEGAALMTTTTTATTTGGATSAGVGGTSATAANATAVATNNKSTGAATQLTVALGVILMAVLAIVD
jgi:hypothetical protein